jgi:hypothetical protein
MEKGYDTGPIHDGCEARGVRPIIPLKETEAVKRGHDLPPTCEHGVWTFAGADFKRKATTWRCPTGECSPASTWVKADRLRPADPARDEAVRIAAARTRRGRAHLRPLEEERVRPCTAPRSWT